MSIYDVSGNLIVTENGMQLNMKQNNANFIQEFLNVAQSYLGQTDIVYKDGDTIFYKSTSTNGIDCSTFVGLCMMGLSYQDTPYYTHQYVNPRNLQENTNYTWALPVIQYKVKAQNDDYPSDEYKYATSGGRQMRWLYERGLAVSMSNGFRDVRAGDIVGWSRKRAGSTEWQSPTSFLHMNHIAIVLSKEDAPNTYVDKNGVTRNWDKEKYPYKHTIIEVTSTTPPCINTHWLEEGQEDSTDVWHNNVNTVSAIARIDLGSITPTLP